MRSTANAADRIRVGEHVTIFKRGRRWWAEFYSDGRQERKSLKTRSKKQARLEAGRIDMALLSGEPVERPDAAPDRVAISDTVELYLAHLRTEGRRKTTITRYDAPLRRFTEFAMKRGITMLDQVTIRLASEYRAFRHPDVQPKTLACETRVIKQLFGHALVQELVEVNPLRNLKVGKAKPRPQPVYSLDDVERILQAAPEPFASAFGLLAFTGMRIGELAHLEWSDVDLEDRWLHVREKEGWQPKTGQNRSLPLNDRAMSILEALPHRGRWVVYQEVGHEQHQVSERRALKELKKVLAEVGIQDGKLHTFRHFFISFCANNGVPPMMVMEWVGQRDLSVILHYYHLSGQESQRAMSKLSFGSNVHPNESGSDKDRNKDSGDGKDAA